MYGGQLFKAHMSAARPAWATRSTPEPLTIRPWSACNWAAQEATMPHAGARRLCHEPPLPLPRRHSVHSRMPHARPLRGGWLAGLSLNPQP